MWKSGIVAAVIMVSCLMMASSSTVLAGNHGRTYSHGLRNDSGHRNATIPYPNNHSSAWQNYVNFVKSGKKVKTCKDNLIVTTNLQMAQSQINQNITNATTNIQRGQQQMGYLKANYDNCQTMGQLLNPIDCTTITRKYLQYQQIVSQNQQLLSQNQSRGNEARWHLNNMAHSRDRMNCDQAYRP